MTPEEHIIEALERRFNEIYNSYRDNLNRGVPDASCPLEYQRGYMAALVNAQETCRRSLAGELPHDA